MTKVALSRLKEQELARGGKMLFILDAAIMDQTQVQGGESCFGGWFHYVGLPTFRVDLDVLMCVW